MAADRDGVCVGSGSASIPGRRGFALCYVRCVSEPAADPNVIVCPHCKKPFEGDLLARGTRHQGFKCPHCRLFVPVERVDGTAA
jgi:hypothetical protein